MRAHARCQVIFYAEQLQNIEEACILCMGAWFSRLAAIPFPAPRQPFTAKYPHSLLRPSLDRIPPLL
jgi:hypothetical protein